MRTRLKTTWAGLALASPNGTLGGDLGPHAAFCVPERQGIVDKYAKDVGEPLKSLRLRQANAGE